MPIYGRQAGDDIGLKASYLYGFSHTSVDKHYFSGKNGD